MVLFFDLCVETTRYLTERRAADVAGQADKLRLEERDNAHLMANTHRRRRRDSTVGGIN